MQINRCRGGSRTAAASKMELFVRAITTKSSFLDIAAVLDPPLRWLHSSSSLCWIPLCCDLFGKRIDKKNLYSNKQIKFISCSRVCKILFCSELPDILERLWRRRRERQLQSVMLSKQMQQQGLQTFDFCVVNVNNEDTKLRLKRKVRG